MPDRAVAPVLGAVLLVALAVVMAAGVSALVTVEPPGETRSAVMTLSVGADGTVAVTHRGGAAVEPGRLRVRISVDGRRLDEQPPVPFFAADGFASGPTGPFNRGYAGSWRAGETATLRIAATNRPAVSAGATVTVRLSLNGRRLAVLEATA